MNVQSAIATVDLSTIKGRQQLAWGSGDYAIVGTTLQIVGETLCEAVDLRSNQRVLDVIREIPRGSVYDRNGVPLADGGHFSGVNTNTLTVSNVTTAEVGAYDVRVTGGYNGAIGVASNPATLSVCVLPGDVNDDNQFNKIGRAHV